MTRSVAECEYRLLLQARDRNRDGRSTHVVEHEVCWCEDGQTAMCYLYFGAPGDDPREVEVADIAAAYYSLDYPTSEADFDAQAAARHFVGVVQSINSGVGFRVY
jgi:hypothetical protein